jgi:hypothetical protein
MATAVVERQSQTTTVKSSRAEKASTYVGPVGYLFGSAIAAHLLALFLEEPETRFHFGDLEARTGATKYALQQCLKTLEHVGLVWRGGRAYRFATESPLAQPIAEVIKVSKRVAQQPQRESFAESVTRWAGVPEGTYSVEGPSIENPAPEAVRIARFKRRPRTPLDKRQTFEQKGAFAI